KGLEFDVVAVPDLSRSLLAGARPPLLLLGREQPPRVGMQLRRLGTAAVNLYEYTELLEESRERDSEEGLRLFHVAATRARRRLILSGVVKPEPGREVKASTPVIERLVEALGVARDADTEVAVPPPEPRPGLEASFAPSAIAVRANLPTPERAAELRALRREGGGARELGAGPPPLAERQPPVAPSRPLSYTAISAYEECGYRFYLERVLGVAGGSTARRLSPTGLQTTSAPPGDEVEGTPSAREERTARGAAVHALLEWSQANGWREPSEDLARRHATAAGLDGGRLDPADLLGPIRAWLGSPLHAERIAGAARVRAEVPILLGAGGTVLRGSIDLLVERDGAPPLVVDYKTDRLGGSTPAEHAARYSTQRAIYALAAAEALGTEEVEVAYVFLERPEEPVLTLLGPDERSAGRAELERAIDRIHSGEFPVARLDRRDWPLCNGCPALGNLCSGPEAS
ncbi:MAG: PD-(D/E)XK nuclease family protein, partial [Actinobacteria bacterium]|nr:PD-(D/E)XK nuclease family protein [Actinomycetota bacterium]